MTTAAHSQVVELPFLLSARRPAQLRQVAERLMDALADPSASLEPRDVACTLLRGREPLGHRLAVVATDLRELRAALSRWLADPDQEIPGLRSTVSPGVPSARPSSAERAASRWVQGETPRW